MRRIIILIAALAVLVAPAVADAKKPSTRARVHRLEQRVRALEAIATDASDTAYTALSASNVLYACIMAVAVDPFTLPGADPSLDQYPLGLSKRPLGSVPTYWMAVIDGSCLAAPVDGVKQTVGPRVRSLRGAR